MSKCKILLDCLSNFVGQNISPDLGQNNGRPGKGLSIDCVMLKAEGSYQKDDKMGPL